MMNDQPMIQALSQVPSYRLRALTFDIPSAYRTIVEILAYYDKMDGLEEIDRLNDVKEWLEEGLTELFGQEAVQEWEEEAKSSEYSPFAS